MSTPLSSSNNLLDLLKNKNRNLNMVKVHRKADGTVVKASESGQSNRPRPSFLNGAGSMKSASRPNAGSRQSSATISRQSSDEPRNPIRQAKAQRTKRPSPAISTPQFTDSDDDDESQTPRKKAKIAQQPRVDPSRTIRDVKAFSDDPERELRLTHAADIANSEPQEHGRYKYGPYFTALTGDEDECPTINLQYPSIFRRERYQVVKPNDKSDFKPLAEIVETMKMVAEFYVDDATAEKITSPQDGSGMAERLDVQARAGDRGKPGAQTKFINIVKEYNKLLSAKRKDGTIARYLDEMPCVPLPLVEHIVKAQVYSRTVSPQIHLVSKYEGFSDNVYGELLPKFLSQIFKITRLRSDKVFVDLGSGVGNCVVQAALETGCEAWGCEMMDNCAKLASLQVREFVPRCKMWGIKPGKVNLIHGDFLKSQEIGKALKRADVVLINNQAFTPALNDALKNHFLDLKEGCQIISLKPFRDPSHKIKDTNVNDPINVLKVIEKERWSNMVSWTDDPGKWFLQVKDSTELKEFVESLQNGS